MWARLLVGLAGLLFLVAEGCGSSGAPGRGELVLFAASSLQEGFHELAQAFEGQEPGVKVTTVFAGTPTLRLQLEEGARADLFASADEWQMELAVQHGIVEGPVHLFATNSLVVITAGLSSPVRSLEDLAAPGVRLVLGLEGVPVGAYAREVLAAVGRDLRYGPQYGERVLANAVSYEANVKQVVAKVQLGEADAGIVYASDVAEGLSVIHFPEQHNVRARYLVARVRGSAYPELAQQFMTFLLSAEGQAVLQRHGFGPGEP